MSDVFRTLIVEAAYQQEAVDVADEYEGGQGMFQTPLSPSGLSPATDYISSGYMSQELVDALSEVDGMYSSDEAPFVALNSLGLKIINE